MVNGKLIAIGALVVCAVAVGAVIYTLPSDDVAYPSAMKVDSQLQDFRIDLSYHSDKIYEGTGFKVVVFDRSTETVVEGANVSFMLPTIYCIMPKEGYVYFCAPDIYDKYLLHPNETSRTFPITVKKDGYNTYTRYITVHLAE